MSARHDPNYPWRRTRLEFNALNGVTLVAGIANYILVVDAWMVQGQNGAAANTWAFEDTTGVAMNGAWFAQPAVGSDGPTGLDVHGLGFSIAAGRGLRTQVGGGGSMSGFVIFHFEPVG